MNKIVINLGSSQDNGVHARQLVDQAFRLELLNA